MFKRLKEDDLEVSLDGRRFWLILCSRCQGIASIDVLVGGSQQSFCTKLTRQGDNSIGQSQ